MKSNNLLLIILLFATIVMPAKAQIAVPHLYVEQDTCVEINEVVVTGLTGTTKMKYSPTPITVVNKATLRNQSSTNIIDAISRQPGITQVTTGGAISKPVIRGLGYNRVVVVNDGIRQEGQQWGDEHGIEIDAESVNSVEILKGPASLRYGSDAMAGVIIFHDAPQLNADGLKATVTTEYQTNNGLYDYSGALQKRQGDWFYGTRISQTRAHAYKNKYDHYVFGSQFLSNAFSANVGRHHDLGQSQLKLSAYHLTPSIVEGERDEYGQFKTSENEYNPKSYGQKSLPYQKIFHFKAVLDNTFNIADGSLKAIVAYQQNRRKEYEEFDQAGLDLKLNTVNYDVHYHTPLLNEWQFVTGVGGMYQQSENKGSEYLIPDYDLFDIGLFATASRTFNQWTISGGLRADHRHLHVDGLIDEGNRRFSEFSRNINGYTGSVGFIYNITSRMNFRANTSRGFRSPNISELSSNGIHEGTARYEIGESKLKPEYSTQFDVGFDYSSYFISLQLSLFANHIDHFIFAKHIGQIFIGEAYRAYQYTQGDARLYGGEITLDMHPMKNLHFDNSFSFVNARLLHQPAESRWLPLTPAPRWNSDLKYEWPSVKLSKKASGVNLSGLFVGCGLECNLRQNHFYALDDTETETPSYTLIHASVGTDIMKGLNKLATFAIVGSNLTDKAYQSHLSRLKNADVNPVTKRRGVFNMGRNVSFKLTLFI